MSENILNKNQHQLLMRIINNKWCFDKRDNTFKLSNRKMAGRLKVSASSVDQLIRVLNTQKLLATITVSTLHHRGHPEVEKRRMLSPIFMWWYHKYEKWTAIAWWHLKTFEAVKEWRKMCRELDCYVDPETGEMFDFNWWWVTFKADRYNCFDRCWRSEDDTPKGRTEEQGYRLEECSLPPLTQYDKYWIGSIRDERYKQRI